MTRLDQIKNRPYSDSNMTAMLRKQMWELS